MFHDWVPLAPREITTIIMEMIMIMMMTSMIMITMIPKMKMMVMMII